MEQLIKNKGSLAEDILSIAKNSSAQVPQAPGFSNSGTGLTDEQFSGLSDDSKLAVGWQFGSLNPDFDFNTTKPVEGGSVTVPNELADMTFRPPAAPIGIGETRARVGRAVGSDPTSETGLPLGSFSTRPTSSGLDSRDMPSEIYYDSRNPNVPMDSMTREPIIDIPSMYSAMQESGPAPRSNYATESAAREARMDIGPDFNEAYSSRQPGEMTMEQATRLAGGNRAQARRLVEMSRMPKEELSEREKLQNELLRQRIASNMPRYEDVNVMSPQERANLQRTLAQTETERIKQAGLLQELNQKGIETQYTRSKEESQSISELTSYGEQINKLTGVRDEVANITGQESMLGLSRDNIYTQGGLGWLNSKLPLGSDARSVARLVKEIEGSTFIRGIIDAKSRGATFGPLSDQEGSNIVAAYGKILEPDMNNEDRINAINDLLSSMNAGFEGASARHAAKFGQSKEQEVSRPSKGSIPNVDGVTIKFKY